jgi:hypothetical protein
MVSIGDTSLSAFLKEEFSGYNFKDKRLLNSSSAPAWFIF